MRRWLLIRRISGNSMLPSLKPGQLVVGLKTNKLKKGNVVLFQHDDIEKIKRVSRVRAQKVYVLGDNAPDSADSRNFGWVSKSAIIAGLVWPRRNLH